jgi:alkanesulfonate monooxygenase SsuD/methylene tetrahydromethanopterin reductase-like flavin-dependent oxidoreductase (luciferase family)
MRVGISLTSAYAVKNPREGAARMIARARAAHEAGLDSLFVGDHHATPVPYYSGPMSGRGHDHVSLHNLMSPSVRARERAQGRFEGGTVGVQRERRGGLRR